MSLAPKRGSTAAKTNIKKQFNSDDFHFFIQEKRQKGRSRITEDNFLYVMRVLLVENPAIAITNSVINSFLHFSLDLQYEVPLLAAGGLSSFKCSYSSVKSHLSLRPTYRRHYHMVRSADSILPSRPNCLKACTCKTYCCFNLSQVKRRSGHQKLVTSTLRYKGGKEQRACKGATPSLVLPIPSYRILDI